MTTDAQSGNAGPFPALDSSFTSLYRRFTAAAAGRVPVLVVAPGTLTLVRPGFPSLTAQVPNAVASNLKSIAHLGPGLYALGELGRSADSSTATWAADTAALRAAVEAALRAVDATPWDSDAWPAQAAAVQEFARDGLTLIDDFLIGGGSAPWTPDAYRKCMRAFAPYMAGYFLLALISNVYGIHQTLSKWRTGMADGWKQLWTVIIGSTGSGGARGLSPQTTNMTDVLALVLSETQLHSQLIVVPTATTVADAMVAVGNAVTTRGLGDNAFPGTEQRNLLGIYPSIVSQTKDLAIGPTRAATQLIGMGGGALQVPGLGVLEIARGG